MNSPNYLCCYVIESGGKNNFLWNKILFIVTMEQLQLRQSFSIIMPTKITTLTANEIMIIETTLSTVITKTPLEQIERPIIFQFHQE